MNDKKVLIKVLIVVISVICLGLGLGYYLYDQSKTGDETASNNKRIVDEESETLDKLVKLDDTNNILNSVFETASILKIEKITNIQFLPSKKGYIIEVDTGDKKLYMGAGEMGFVDIVRENSINGNIIYVVEE